MLAEAGYPDGFETTLSFDLGAAVVNEPLCILIQENLAQIGVKVTIDKIAGSNWRAAFTKKTLPLHNQMFGGWFNFPDYFFIVYNGAKATIYNSMDYHSAEMDKAIAAAHYTSDQKAYDENVVKFIQLSFDDRTRHPVIPTVPQSGNAAQCDRLSLFVPSAARLSAFREDLKFVRSDNIMRLSVYFDGFATMSEMLEAAAAAENAGASALWYAQHMGYRDAFVGAATAASVTRRAELVPTAISVYSWPPLQTAMSIASLDDAAPGRAALAVAVGNMLNLAESGFEPVTFRCGPCGNMSRRCALCWPGKRCISTARSASCAVRISPFEAAGRSRSWWRQPDRRCCSLPARSATVSCFQPA